MEADPFDLDIELGPCKGLSYEKVSTLVQIADLIPINAFPSPATWALGFVLDVGALYFGYTDIVKAEQRGDLTLDQSARAYATLGVATGLSITGYIPGAGYVLGPVAEGSAYIANVYNLTGQINPFHNW